MFPAQQELKMLSFKQQGWRQKSWAMSILTPALFLSVLVTWLLKFDVLIQSHRSPLLSCQCSGQFQEQQMWLP